MNQTQLENFPYPGKCKVIQTYVNCKKIDKKTTECLTSTLMIFSSILNESKMGSNERNWCKCNLYQVWVNTEELTFQMFFNHTCFPWLFGLISVIRRKAIEMKVATWLVSKTNDLMSFNGFMVFLRAIFVGIGAWHEPSPVHYASESWLWSS